MADDQQGNLNTPQNTSQSSQNFATDVAERPLNPTKNAADLIGDTSGMSGITQGSAQQTSAEPTARTQDESSIQGAGLIQHVSDPNPTGIPKEAVSDTIYAQNTAQGMSEVTKKAASDAAAEPDPLTPSSQHSGVYVSVAPQASASGQMKTNPSQPTPTQPADFGKQTDTTYPTTQDAPYMHPDNQGEQDAAGGTTSDPRSDDDTLAMAQRAGFQTNEDPEHPQPLDAARDIDQAEQAIKSS